MFNRNKKPAEQKRKHDLSQVKLLIIFVMKSSNE